MTFWDYLSVPPSMVTHSFTLEIGADRVVPKRRFQTILRRVIIRKAEEFMYILILCTKMCTARECVFWDIEQN
jgi:hypothetical protein